MCNRKVVTLIESFCLVYRYWSFAMTTPSTLWTQFWTFGIPTRRGSNRMSLWSCYNNKLLWTLCRLWRTTSNSFAPSWMTFHWKLSFIRIRSLLIFPMGTWKGLGDYSKDSSSGKQTYVGLIEASLSEPHTSTTALHTCVSIPTCLLAWTDHLS